MVDPLPSSAPTPASPIGSGSQRGFRQLQWSSTLGLIGQILIWSSVVALWIFGSLFSTVPARTTIAYGANNISVPASLLFAVYDLLLLGALAALISLVLSALGYRQVAKALPRLPLGPAVALTTLGAIGFGMFVLGSAIWLGSFVPPGSPSFVNTTDYAPVLAQNLSSLVGLLLLLGGLLAFLGMLGIALGSSSIGVAYEEFALELGGPLSALPVLSIFGYGMSLVGLVHGARKLAQGWSPPPVPPPPAPSATFSYTGYPVGSPYPSSSQQRATDNLLVVLVVSLVVLWMFIMPFAFLFFSAPLTKGPGNTPIGGNSSNPPASSTGLSPPVLLVFVGLVITAVLVSLAVARTRRRRQKVEIPPTPPPPPPLRPPTLPAREEDPLDHLV